jgi:hypothetical protein
MNKMVENLPLEKKERKKWQRKKEIKAVTTVWRTGNRPNSKK